MSGTTGLAIGSLTVYDTFVDAKAALMSSNQSSGPSVIQTLGYTTPGDGGGGFYSSSNSPPTSAFYFLEGTNYYMIQPSCGLFYYPLVRHGIYNVLQFGADSTGASDSTVEIQNAIKFYNVFIAGDVTSPNYNVRPKLVIPPGLYSIKNLFIEEINAPGRGPSDPNPSHAYLNIEGAGVGNTVLQCSEPKGAALSIRSGNCSIRSLRITSTADRENSTDLNAHGILVKQWPEPSTTNITRVMLEDLWIDVQPGDGIHLDQIEQVEINRVWSEYNSGNGLYSFYDDTIKPALSITVGCEVRSCRFSNNKLSGINTFLHNSTFINVETLGNGVGFTPSGNGTNCQFYMSGDRNVILNPDVEDGKNANGVPIDGLVLIGDLNTVIGGIFNRNSGCSIVLRGNSATITDPGIGAGWPGVAVGEGTTGHNLRLVQQVINQTDSSGNPLPTIEAFIVSPPTPDPGSTYSIAVRSVDQQEQTGGSFTTVSTTTPPAMTLQGTLRSYPGISTSENPLLTQDGELNFSVTLNNGVPFLVVSYNQQSMVYSTTLALSSPITPQGKD